jgi:hypothetical protein
MGARDGISGLADELRLVCIAKIIYVLFYNLSIKYYIPLMNDARTYAIILIFACKSSKRTSHFPELQKHECKR